MRMNLAVILARGGSKRLPNKNIIPLCGKPLIAYAIELAHSCPLIDDLLVSTDSPEIQSVAIRHNAKAPFLRPAELASDHASSYDALKHAVLFYEANNIKNHQKVDKIILLQPTSPLTRPATLIKTIQLLDDGTGFEFAHTVIPTPKRFEWIGELDGNHFSTFVKENEKALFKKKMQVAPSGNVYVMTRNFLFQPTGTENLPQAGFLIDLEEAVDIDYRFDLEIAQFLIAKRGTYSKDPK